LIFGLVFVSRSSVNYPEGRVPGFTVSQRHVSTTSAPPATGASKDKLTYKQALTVRGSRRAVVRMCFRLSVGHDKNCANCTSVCRRKLTALVYLQSDNYGRTRQCFWN